MVTYRTCRHCGKKFLPARNDNRIKYCSKQCREKNWVLNNKERNRELKKISRDKKPVLCRSCGEPIPNSIRKHGLVFCSDKCRKVQNRLNDKKHRVKKFNRFKEYKESVGCKICGYNKYFGSLDFHHVDPTEKEIRITATHFTSNSDKIKRELEKCILVCKNCHYELHYLINNNVERYWQIMNEVKDNSNENVIR